MSGSRQISLESPARFLFCTCKALTKISRVYLAACDDPDHSFCNRNISDERAGNHVLHAWFGDYHSADDQFECHNQRILNTIAKRQSGRRPYRKNKDKGVKWFSMVPGLTYHGSFDCDGYFYVPRFWHIDIGLIPKRILQARN
jgi:hypothetical protein